VDNWLFEVHYECPFWGEETDRSVSGILPFFERIVNDFFVERLNLVLSWWMPSGLNSDQL